jgi:hypothetical protein
MILLRDKGLEAGTLLDLICWRLCGVPLPPVPSISSSHWVIVTNRRATALGSLTIA